MKHQTLHELQTIADVSPSVQNAIMTRIQRIERWAELLEKQPSRCLGALTGTEYLHPRVREEARAAGSPITVAFEDPMLRASGLEGDSYGEAKRFFKLSDWQLHEIVCSCHAGGTMPASWAAARVRRTIRGNKFLAWLRNVLMR
ncbi:hypothetical protein RFM98_00255 [Mesorhizobium sp. VK9D]|uniref:hypothetical protein n=1 Tax=Mesorhizobium australafricanum TaxID=3072311 RepID=UPI002A2436E1|nr:hypothetical protein [Mesorhizobium sp. VK9D]MDX8451182.1 hypothetical protein [Mesorhizobium sp. VK9D]